MRFYYFSLVSWTVYLVYGVIAIALLSLLWTKVLELKLRNPGYWILAAAALIAPWGEELWISYKFDQLCRKDAGIVISKEVEVDGFYDATMRSAYELTKKAGYRFVEHPTEDRTGTERVELATSREREKALTWYTARNPGSDRPKDRSVLYPVNDKETIAVIPNGEAWKVTRLDKPAARYQYRRGDNHTPVAHEIKRYENTVIDVQTGDVLGRYTNYRRGPYWFFISLGAPTIPCAETEAATRKYGTLIYREVLKPAK